MNQKNLHEYKQKYDVARHHAWAGSVLLAVLIAIRGFFEITDIKLNDTIIVIIGIILIIYILTSVFYTYKYRSGLTDEQQKIEVHVKSKDNKKQELESEVEKQRLKVEKKKAKIDAKKTKKSYKK